MLAPASPVFDDAAVETGDENGLALLSVAEMAAADRAMIAGGVSGDALMERAGRAVADAVARRSRPGDAVLVLCGPGNNGGDGFVAARLLRERGLRVTLALAGVREALRGDAEAAAGRWTEPVLGPDAVAPRDHAIIVDALFGAGLSRPLTGQIAALADAVNASGRPVVAVDVPSGLSGDSGQPDGPVIRAAETVTFFRLKPGHLLHPGRGLCGVVTLADIGIAPGVVFGAGHVRPSVFRNHPDLWRGLLPRRAADTHKFRQGSVLVVAGGLAGVGAPRLSARAALRSGAGLVTVACRAEAQSAHASRGPDALMQRTYDDEAGLAALLAGPRLSATVIGPALGLDGPARQSVMAVLRSAVPAVLDADALTALALRPRLAWNLVSRRGGPCVLTPHEGEFRRLFGTVSGCDAASKLERARQAARLSGAVVVLKGADTVIAAGDGRAAINASGTPDLATAGSGDVLAGIIAGLMAQGMPTFPAACAAVHLHGLLAERLGRGLIADDLPEAIPAVLAGLTTSIDP